MQHRFRIAAIGELLWDLLPHGPRLGGAPANFAAITANLAVPSSTGAVDEVFLISRVGADRLGSDALSKMSAHGVRVEHISTDSVHPTGRVPVEFGADGNPTYRIDEQAAWDFLPETPELIALAPTLDAVCFGTLAQRSAPTRHMLRRLVEATRPDCVRVFDVNLRDPWWTPESIVWGLAHATILKMSLEESSRVAQAVERPFGGVAPREMADACLERYPIEMVAITRGANGSLLATRSGVEDHPGIAVRAEDSVGAGDAFAAAMTCAWLRGDSLACISESANQWGAWATTQPGGMSLPDEKVRRSIRAAISTRCGR